MVGVLADPLGEPADVVEFRIVRGESHRTGVGGDGVEFVGGASDEDQVDLGCREGSGGDRPDAVTGTGDHDGCARTHGGAITFGDEDAGYGRRSARSVACRCGRILEQGLAQGDQVEHVEHHRFGTEVSTDVSIHLSCRLFDDVAGVVETGAQSAPGWVSVRPAPNRSVLRRDSASRCCHRARW